MPALGMMAMWGGGWLLEKAIDEEVRASTVSLERVLVYVHTRVRVEALYINLIINLV